MNLPAEWPDDTRVLIPAYRAESLLRTTLPSLLSRVPASHVMVVDDGSGDSTPALCQSLAVRSVIHPTNQGKGAALRTGFASLAQQMARWVVTMDADGQHSVEDLPALLEAAQSGPYPCLWIGRRDMRVGVMPAPRIVSNKLTSWGLSVLSGQRILDSQSGYRAYPLSAMRKLALRYSRFEFESEVILRLAHAGCPIRFVPIRTVYSGAPSNIAHVRDTLRWIQAVFSVWRELHRQPWY
jgi:glycosyltransferase involved in cell wall biosynthesis